MVGLGETRDELTEAFEALREVDCDILTIGQYLRPSLNHLPLERYYHPDEFAEMKAEALELGFRHVESGPLVRSSYHARDQVPGAELAPSAARRRSTPTAGSSLAQPRERAARRARRLNASDRRERVAEVRDHAVNRRGSAANQLRVHVLQSGAARPGRIAFDVVPLGRRDRRLDRRPERSSAACRGDRGAAIDPAEGRRRLPEPGARVVPRPALRQLRPGRSTPGTRRAARPPPRCRGRPSRGGSAPPRHRPVAARRWLHRVGGRRRACTAVRPPTPGSRGTGHLDVARRVVVGLGARSSRCRRRPPADGRARSSAGSDGRDRAVRSACPTCRPAPRSWP